MPLLGHDPTLVVLAAGISARYGGGKQLALVGANGEALFDYAILDAHRAGFRQFVLVIRQDAQQEFDTHLNQIWGSRLDVAFAFQDLPVAPRTRPWGTGHAVLSSRAEVHGPFVVINADDWYPPAGYVQLASILGGRGRPEYAAVVYRLDSTPMSPDGGVSRGVCEIADDGFLRSMVEVQDIESAGGGYAGRTVDGTTMLLSGSELVSMNLWGFTDAIFGPLADQFYRFQKAHTSDHDAEFFIGAAMDAQVRAGQCTVRVIDGGAAGFGMTYRADTTTVTDRIQALVATGTYPRALPDGLD